MQEECYARENGAAALGSPAPGNLGWGGHLRSVVLALVMVGCGSSFVGTGAGEDDAGRSDGAAADTSEPVPAHDGGIGAELDVWASGDGGELPDAIAPDAHDASSGDEDASGSTSCPGFDRWDIPPAKCLYVNQGTYLVDDDAGAPVCGSAFHVNGDTCVIFDGKGTSARTVYVSSPTSSQFRMLRDSCPEP